MSDKRTNGSADDQIDLWQRLRAAQPETLQAIEQIAQRLPPAQRQALWHMLAVVYQRAKTHQPMPHDIWKLLTPEQRAVLSDEQQLD